MRPPDAVLAALTVSAQLPAERVVLVVLLVGAVLALLLAAVSVLVRLGRRVHEEAAARERELRQRAEEARARLAAILDSLPEAASAFDQHWRWTYLNPTAATFLRALGKDPVALIGRVLWDEAPQIVGTPLHGQILRAATERCIVEHLEYVAPLGAWLECRVVPLPDGIVLYARDVTASVRAQHALRDEARLVEMLHRIGTTVAAELDAAKLAQLVTDEATALTGAQFGALMYRAGTGPEPEMRYAVAGVPRERFARFPLPRGTPVFAPTFRGEGIVRSDDITKDPRYGHVAPHHGLPQGHPPVRSYLAVPVVSRAGTPLGGLFLAHEEPGRFTERHERIVAGIASWAAVAMDNARLYEAERTARAEAQAASRVKSDFLATMSHELRTPLNAIAGYAELLAMGVRGPVTEEQREDLLRIQRSQRHLLSLINDVLNFTKIDAGHVDLDLRDVELRDIVGGLEALVAPQLRVRSLHYTCEGCNLALRVRADPEKVQQVLLNLLSNAIKFTEPGGHITVRSEAIGDVVAIGVSDTGCGVPEEEMEQIFEPFVQIHRSLTSAHEGTGLGLAISRDLARAMGGDLTLTSRVGEGSTFTLTLPMARTG